MKSIFLLGLGFLITTCTSRTEYFVGKFIETGYNDYRSFEFEKNGTFKFIGFNKRSIAGRYMISDSIIFLSPDTDLIDRDLRLKLKIINSECIRDYDNIFYCANAETGKELNKTEYKFQEETVSILDTLQEVRHEREILDELNRIWNDKYKYDKIMVSDLYVDYAGIMVVDGQELHVFQYPMQTKADSCRRNRGEQFLRLLVKKKPFEVYRIFPGGNPSLKLVYEGIE